MDPRSAAGLTTIQYVAATSLSLLLFVGLANAIVDLYARGVARAAVDEAARAGAAFEGGADECRRRAQSVLEGAVPRGTIRISCREAGGAMHAHADVELPGWLPGIPAWEFALDGEVVEEQLR